MGRELTPEEAQQIQHNNAAMVAGEIYGWADIADTFGLNFIANPLYRLGDITMRGVPINEETQRNLQSGVFYPFKPAKQLAVDMGMRMLDGYGVSPWKHRELTETFEPLDYLQSPYKEGQ